MRRSPVYAPGAMSVADAEGPSSRLTELRVSARGWHGIQLAVIGFIGFCGVLQDGRPDNPTWLQVWAAILVLGRACARVRRDIPRRPCGVAAVRRSPVGRRGLRARSAAPQKGAAPDVRRRRRAGARHGLGLVAAVGGRGGGGQLVAVQASSGERACGSLVQASPGTLRVSVDGRTVDVALQDVAAVDPVDSC